MTTSASHWTVVREVISSTNDGAMVMSALPGLVRRLLDEEAWREFTAPGGAMVRHETFTDFVRAKPPKCLGGRADQLTALCGSDHDLIRRVDGMLYGEAKPLDRDGIHTGDRSRGTRPKGESETRRVIHKIILVKLIKL